MMPQMPSMIIIIIGVDLDAVSMCQLCFMPKFFFVIRVLISGKSQTITF